MSWPAALKSLLRGRAIWGSPPRVAEATRYYLKRKGDSGIGSLADLNGKRFGSRSSSSGLLELTEFEHRLAKAGGVLGEGTEYPTYREAAKALTDKQIDYVIGDLTDLRIAIRDNPNDLEIGDAVSQKIFVAWPVAKNSPEVAGLVSDYLAQARKSGELGALQQKFLGAPFTGFAGNRCGAGLVGVAR